MTSFPETSLRVLHIAEPSLGFGFDQSGIHPKDGLYLFGPHLPPTRKEISVGVVGTASGINYLKDWIASINRTVQIPERTPRDKKYRPHLSDFPGLQEAFGLRVKEESLTTYTLKSKDVLATTAIENLHEAVAKTTDLFLAPIERHDANEEQTIDVWVFVVPEIVFETCRPEAGKRRKAELTPGEYARKQKKRTALPLLEPIIDSSLESVFDDVPDFHRQIKARLLKLNHTSQLIRETTIAPEQFLNSAGKPKRGTQDAASIAWNLATGLFYKTQPFPPWKIANMRPGVCYVGLVFKQIPNHPKNHACCAAQMFLSEGDGVVFRGANGPWKSDDYEYHLQKDAAQNLIKTVLETYKTKFDEYPKELFIHGKTKFNDEEWNAFAEAAPDGTNIVGVRIKSTHGEMKLYREGDYPCIRGTAIILNDTNAFLWTTGYVPRIDTYMGPETPNPLFITVLRASGEFPPLENVLTDIHALTKVNYNACNFNDSTPVTIRFAEKVGEVLVMGSAKEAARQPFKFYI